MHPKIVHLFQSHRKLTEEIYPEISSAIEDVLVDVKEKNFSPEQLADIGYLCRQIDKLCDELRKDAKARAELCGRVIALAATKRAIVNGGVVETVRGEIARATPSVTHEPNIPGKGTREHNALLKAIGVSDECAKKGLVKVHYPSLQALMVERAELAQPLPEGLGVPRARYYCSFRKN